MNLKQEVLIWAVCSISAVVAFLLSHTFYVTTGTYVYGVIFCVFCAPLVWIKFRRRTARPDKSWQVISSCVLVLLGFVFLLYLLGVATWYE